jgi:uncharacterized protein YbaP (TraB family)
MLILRARVAAAFILLSIFAATPLRAAETYAQGLLWRIDGKGAPASHVFGTIHLADARVTALPVPVAREFKQARSLTIEAGANPASLVAVANRMIYTDGRDLPGVAGEALYKRVAALSGGMGLPEAAVRIFKPWAMTLMLSVPPQDPTQVLDFVLARTAQELGKVVLELESLDEQVAVFEGMPEADQVALLQHAVTNYERLPRIIERLIGEYLRRDLAALWRISEESGGEMGRIKEIFVQRLIYDRNDRMAQRMEATLGQGGAFFALGALHLYGDRGVLARLQQRGWRVTRVY